MGERYHSADSIIVDDLSQYEHMFHNAEDTPCLVEAHDESVAAEYAAYFTCGCKRLYCTVHMDKAIEIKNRRLKMGWCDGFGQHSRSSSDLTRWERL